MDTKKTYMTGSRRIGPSTKNTGLSIDPVLLKRGKKEAARRRQSFSAYIQSLLASDLGLDDDSERSIRALEQRLRRLEEERSRETG
jgi:hypothetical protein